MRREGGDKQFSHHLEREREERGGGKDKELSLMLC